MPQMGVSVSEGTITKWLKQPARQSPRTSRCSRSRPTRSTPRSPSPGEGVVAEILVAEGATVDVGTLLAGSRRPAPPWPSPRPHPPLKHRPSLPRAAPPRLHPSPSRRASPLRLRRRRAAASGNGRTFVSPVVARIAAEEGVDPSAVTGTGTGGRVTKKDILAYIESGAAHRHLRLRPPPGCTGSRRRPAAPRRRQLPLRRPRSLHRRAPAAAPLQTGEGLRADDGDAARRDSPRSR